MYINILVEAEMFVKDVEWDFVIVFVLAEIDLKDQKCYCVQ